MHSLTHFSVQMVVIRRLRAYRYSRERKSKVSCIKINYFFLSGAVLYHYKHSGNHNHRHICLLQEKPSSSQKRMEHGLLLEFDLAAADSKLAEEEGHRDISRNDSENS